MVTWTAGFSKVLKLYLKCSLWWTVKFSEGKVCSLTFNSGRVFITFVDRLRLRNKRKRNTLHVRILYIFNNIDSLIISTGRARGIDFEFGVYLCFTQRRDMKDIPISMVEESK
jgi:hypothetical protein